MQDPLLRSLRLLGSLTALGVAVLIPTAVSAQNLVTNPGFETGDFSGYTLSGDTDFAYITPFAAHTGGEGAALTTSTADGFLSQTLATQPGQAYTISFFLDGDGATPNTFSVAFGGIPLFSQADTAGTASFQQITLTGVASSASTPLTFGFRDDPGYIFLDDISVTAAAVPEASTTVSFGLLLALGIGGVLIAAKRKKAATQANSSA